MAEQPKTRMYVVTKTGTYHFFGIDKEPHLAEHCNGQCGPAAVFTAIEGSTVGFGDSGNSGTVTKLPADAWVAYGAK